MVEYATVDLARAADEVNALSESATVVRMLSDYDVLRRRGFAVGMTRTVFPERA